MTENKKPSQREKRESNKTSLNEIALGLDVKKIV